VAEICELYLRPLHLAVTLVCVDEKTGMQGSGASTQGTTEPGATHGWTTRLERTRKLLAAGRGAPARSTVRCGPPHGRGPGGFMRRARRLSQRAKWMSSGTTSTSTATALRALDRINQRHAVASTSHYTPIHASWVNQVELWFGILQRRVLRHGVFNSLAELDQAVLGFIAHWNANERKPFRGPSRAPLQTGRQVAER